jgi:hypothetical protein
VGGPAADRRVARAVLVAGFVALGTASGIGSDASAVDAAGLRALLAQASPRRRPGKDLRQLEPSCTKWPRATSSPSSWTATARWPSGR